MGTSPLLRYFELTSTEGEMGDLDEYVFMFFPYLEGFHLSEKLIFSCKTNVVNLQRWRDGALA